MTQRHPVLAALLLVVGLALATLGALWLVVFYLTPNPPLEPAPPPTPERLLLRIKAHPHEVVRLAFSPDGAQLASSDWDGNVILWTATDGKVLHTLQGPKRQATCLAFSPDTRRLAAGSADRTVTVWDTITGQEAFRTYEHGDGVTCVAFSADGKHLASGGLDRKVLIHEAGTGRLLKSCPTGSSPPLAIAFGSADRQLIAVGMRGDVRKFDVASGKQLEAHPDQKQELEAVALRSDGGQLACATRTAESGVNEHRSRIHHRNLDDDRATLFLPVLPGPITCLAYSPNGDHLAFGGYDQRVAIWNAGTGQELLTLPHGVVVTAVAWSPDGKRLAAGTKIPGQMGEIRVWNVQP